MDASQPLKRFAPLSYENDDGTSLSCVCADVGPTVNGIGGSRGGRDKDTVTAGFFVTSPLLGHYENVTVNGLGLAQEKKRVGLTWMSSVLGRI